MQVMAMQESLTSAEAHMQAAVEEGEQTRKMLEQEVRKLQAALQSQVSSSRCLQSLNRLRAHKCMLF